MFKKQQSSLANSSIRAYRSPFSVEFLLQRIIQSSDTKTVYPTFRDVIQKSSPPLKPKWNNKKIGDNMKKIIFALLIFGLVLGSLGVGTALVDTEEQTVDDNSPLLSYQHVEQASFGDNSDCCARDRSCCY